MCSSDLDEDGVVRIGTKVAPGDILVGKVVPKSKSELTPEEKLLHAIFGRMGEDVKNDSLEVPSGVEGIVIAAEKFSRRMSLSDEERREFEKQLKEAENEGNARVAEAFGAMIEEMGKAIGKPLTAADGSPMVRRNAALSLVRFGDATGRDEIRSLLVPYSMPSPYAGALSVRLRTGDAVNPGTIDRKSTRLNSSH